MDEDPARVPVLKQYPTLSLVLWPLLYLTGVLFDLELNAWCVNFSRAYRAFMLSKYILQPLTSVSK